MLTEDEEYQYLIKIVQERYQIQYDLNLSVEQAERVYAYEESKNAYSTTDSFSDWEERDYEWAAFKEILTNEQFEGYEEKRKIFIQQIEASLVEEDQMKITDIDYYQEVVRYYENEFLPDFFNNRSLRFFTFLPETKLKVDFLKAEYHRYLTEYRKYVLVTHFRFCRTFRPNLLKVSLLQLKLWHLWPEHSHFSRKMDEPTRATTDHLKKKLDYIDDQAYEFIQKKFNALRTFNELNYKKYFGEPGNIPTVIVEMPPDELREYRLMSLLLLDKDRYGWRD